MVLDQFGDVGGIEQRWLDKDPGAERGVVGIGVDDMPVKSEAEDLQSHDGARREGHFEAGANAGIRDIVQLTDRLDTVVQLGKQDRQIGGKALIESAVHSSRYRRNAGTTLGRRNRA